MPGLSGSDLIIKLRSEHSTLPVIVASGGILAEEVTRDSALQPVTALPKPFTTEQLLAMVAEILPQADRGFASTQVSSHASGDSYAHWGLNE
jgi:DNA-binding NtrC family response regulator